MTTAPPLQAAAESLDQRLQAAVITALDTLVALAKNRAEPGHARLAAAEILRFAARRKPEPPPRPQRSPAPTPRALTAGLGAMLNLFGQLPPTPPSHNIPPEDEDPTVENHAPTPAAEPSPHAPPHASPDHVPENRQPPGRTPEPSSPRPRPDPYARSSARKRKRARQRAAKAAAVPRPG